MPSVIKLDHVTKSFGKHLVMDDVHYDVPCGVVFALLGENGAGKTTTIRTLLGLERPDRGTAEVLGMSSLYQGIEIRRQIGYVPEQPTIYEWMTVGEIGWFTAGFYSGNFLGEYHRLCRDFDLPLQRKLSQLSKGMKAQVSLSLALAHEPQLLILDEPTSGLDTLVRRSFLESMVDVAGAGRTVFLSSHHIHEVERIADMVVIMNRGKILVCESLESLKARLEQWVITLADGASCLPPINAEVVFSESHSHQHKLTLSNPSPDALWQTREHVSVAEVDVHVPSLEEIFVMYLKQSEGQVAPHRASEDRMQESAWEPRS